MLTVSHEAAPTSGNQPVCDAPVATCGQKFDAPRAAATSLINRAAAARFPGGLMHRLTVIAVLLITGCAHRAVPPAIVAAPAAVKVAEPLETPASPDAVAEVEAALRDVTVRFAFDRDLLDDGAMKDLQRLARVLRKHPAVRLTIAGHADERGTEEYNFLLAQRRAESARAYLSVLGVRDEQLNTISYGAEKPLTEEQSEEGYALNRRDDVTIDRGTSVASAE
jgi:peptidoglycan-associated lipoprotein